MWVEIGDQLRQAREKAGLSLEELQEQTQIDMVSLKALENGDFNKISSPFFVRSYIRTVAKKIDLEPTNLLKHYHPVQDETGEGEANKAGGGLGQTGKFSTISQPVEKITDSGRVHTTQPIQPLRMNDGANEESYDPFHNMKEEESEDGGENASGSEEGEHLSRSVTSKSKKWSVSDLTQTLKMKALGNVPILKKDEEQSAENKQEEGDSLSSSSAEGELPPRSQGKRGAISEEEMSSPMDQEEALNRDFQSRESEEMMNEPSVSPPPMDTPQTLSRSGRYRSDAWAGEESGSHDLSSNLPPRGQSASLSEQQMVGNDSTESEPILSRSGRHESVSNLPALVASGEITRSNSKRHRKAVAQNKAGNWFKSPLVRWSLIVVVLLILVSIWAANTMGFFDKNSEKPATTSEKKDGSSSSADAPKGGTAKLLALKEGSSLSEYQLSKPDNVSFRFQTKGKSWIQIREQKNAEEGYLKDVTLNRGETFPYEYKKGKAKELWVTIGSPNQVDLTINGQSVNANKTIHIIIKK
ncbi:protein of unknown function [Marininema mesophilum]|uniref:HTH cro/C1-type domain-containing protein n=1 Tax=Marininema mesophilum TaxID=1048340 RepID=A0A1H2W7D0_9BACL|nr:RodZ domain-containing protein [Marininema mesophilum]SDW76490.1 protein of unknown function [Marininema mesophilum]